MILVGDRPQSQLGSTPPGLRGNGDMRWGEGGGGNGSGKGGGRENEEMGSRAWL